jgi:hypothetical protein
MTISVITAHHLRWFVEYAYCIPGNSITHEPPSSITDENVLFYCSVPKPNDTEFLRDDQIFFVNTEQMTRADLLRQNIEALNILNRSITIIDYSRSQTDMWASLGYKTQYRPYVSPPAETETLRSLVSSVTEFEYDIAHCGWMTPRRRNIMSQLQRLGYRVLIVDAWGLERDRLIAKARCLINIHQGEDCHVFETVRCNRWMSVGKPIVSETGIETPPDSSIFQSCPYDGLVATTVQMLKEIP